MAINEPLDVPLRTDLLFKGEDGKMYMRFNEIRLDDKIVIFVCNGIEVMRMSRPPGTPTDELSLWGFNATMEIKPL